jgi:hypothetical protein
LVCHQKLDRGEAMARKDRRRMFERVQVTTNRRSGLPSTGRGASNVTVCSPASANSAI